MLKNDRKSNNYGDWARKYIRYIALSIALLAHLILFLVVTINPGQKQTRKDNAIFKIVDVKEYIPPPPPEEKKEEKKEKKKEEIKVEKKEEVIEINRQDEVAEDVIETKKEIKEAEIDYLPQHKISELPVLPTNDIKSKIVYPPLANKQGIEGIVYLELYIDQKGELRNIIVLKDPGYGFAEAAIKALESAKCIPAKANGIPVAVRYRYPIRFALK
jgi:protein TonB